MQCDPRKVAYELRQAADILDAGDFISIFAAQRSAIGNWLAFIEAAYAAGSAPDFNAISAWFDAREGN